MDDSIPAEEVSLNNIPVHISSRRRPESPAEISSSEEETNKQMVLNANNCQLYTDIVNVNEEDFCSNSGGFLMNSYNQNNSVLRELSISTGKSDSEFTEEDEDVKPLQSSREDEKYQNNGDISQQNLFFNQDNLIKKGIIKIIMGADTETDSSSCYDISCSSSSHGFAFCSSIDSNCYNNNNNSNNNNNNTNNSNNNTNNNSDKENMSPFPENINSQTCASSTPSAYQHNVEPINSKSRQVEVEILDYNLQSPKKEILSQSSSIYGESLDTSSSIFSKTSSSIPSFSINDTSIEIENTNTSSLMIPNSFEVTGIFSGHDSHHLNSSNRESHSFASERPAGNLISEELEEEGKNGEISQTQNNDFSSNCCVSFDQDNSNNDASVRFNDNNNKDIETSVFSKNCNKVLTEDSLNSKKCAEDTFSSFPSSSSSHEEISFTSILENDSRYQDEMMPSQRNASRLLGYCPEYEKESPQTILNRMQGVDLFIKQQPFLKSYDIRSSHKTSTPLYQRQKLAESQFLETSSNQHDCSQKTFQHSNQIIHTPHPKRGQLIYCHGLIDNSTEFQPQTPMNGPLLNSSGEENSSPEYLQFMNSPFSRPDDACHKSDMCHEDDPIRHQHKLNERKRRARITIACDLMRRLVPGISDKTDQATVFEYAARYIHFLQTQVGNKYNRNFLVKYSPYKLMEIEKFLP